MRARIDDGRDLSGLLGGVHFIQHEQAEPRSEREGERVTDFLGYVEGLVELWKDLSADEKRRAEGHLSGEIRRLARNGLLLFGDRCREKARVGAIEGEWIILKLWIVPGRSPLFPA